MEEWGFAAGDEVLLRGLTKLELNGQRGTVLSLESPEQARQLGRLPVMMHSGKQLSLKVTNLVKVEEHRRGRVEADLTLASGRKLMNSMSNAPQLVVMTFNLQYLATFPQDPNVARRRLLEITSGNRPDIIAVQEGLEGIDLLAQVGYTKLISSAVKAVSLREALYGDETALSAVPEIAQDSLMVNELYLRNESGWEVQQTGVEQISSSLMVSVCAAELPLTPRAVVWAKLSRGAEGPCIFVMNSQLSGARIEDELLLSALGDERSRQVARVVDIFGQHAAEEDLAIFVGDFGAVSGPLTVDAPDAAEAPLESLKDLGWSLAYDQSVVNASCLFGYLADFMATSRKVVPLCVEALGTANVIGEAEVDVPLSDHQAVKAVFSMRSLQSSRTTAVSAEAEIPLLGFGSHFLPEDLSNERLSDDEFYQRADELTQSAVKEALSAGVKLLDSGNRHQNQQSFGLALEKAMQEGLSRNQIFVCGRIHKCKDKEQIRQEVQMLLSELKMEYVDLLIADCPPEQVPGAWPHLEEVVTEGRARFLGVSNFDLLGPKVCVEVFRKFLSQTKIPPSVMALEVHPLNTNVEMCEFCETAGIQVLAYAPLGSQIKVESFMNVLTKSDAREMRPLLEVLELQQLQQIAERHQKTVAQVALRWNLQQGHSILPKSWNPLHIRENLQLFDFCLSAEEMTKISKLHKGVRTERFYQASFTTSKALPRMTRDAFDECQEILSKIRGPKGTVISPCPLSGLDGPVPLPVDVAQRGGHDGEKKVDWEKLGFHRPVEEEPGFWRRMGLATGKGIDGGKGKGKRFPLLKDGLPVGGKGGVPHPAMVGYR